LISRRQEKWEEKGKTEDESPIIRRNEAQTKPKQSPTEEQSPIILASPSNRLLFARNGYFFFFWVNKHDMLNDVYTYILLEVFPSFTCASSYINGCINEKG
jgi:hypothetical protein